MASYQQPSTAAPANSYPYNQTTAAPANSYPNNQTQYNYNNNNPTIDDDCDCDCEIAPANQTVNNNIPYNSTTNNYQYNSAPIAYQTDPAHIFPPANFVQGQQLKLVNIQLPPTSEPGSSFVVDVDGRQVCIYC